MSSIGGLSSGTSSNISSIRGYGGLASGLDRDSLIESMTAGTRAKIAKQQQQKQTYKWQQESLRGISSKLVEFSRKYMSYTNPATNLSSASFFARNSITALGGNSKYLSVSGSSSISDTLSILGVKQMAKNAGMSSNSAVSDQALSTGDMKIFAEDGTVNMESISDLEGQYLSFKYGNKTYGVSLGSGTTSDGFTYDYSTAEKAQESFTKALKNVSIGDGKTLADVISVETTPKTVDGKQTFTMNLKSTDKGGNTILVSGGSESALKALGLLGKNSSVGIYDGLSDEEKTITDGGWEQSRLDKQEFFHEESFMKRMEDKSLTFNYNGSAGKVKISKELLEKAKAAAETKLGSSPSVSDVNSANEEFMNVLINGSGTGADHISGIQDQLDKDFGYGRIKASTTAVGADGTAKSFNLSFKTMDPITGNEDPSSVLSLTSSDAGVMGKTGALHVEYGESNRLNLDATLADSGLGSIDGTTNADYLAKIGLDTADFAGAVKASELIEKLGSKVTSGTTVEELKKLIKDNNPSISDKDYSGVCSALDHIAGGTTAAVGTDIKDKLDQYVSEREMDLTINGTKIKGLTYKSTLNEVINEINSADAGVSISYMKNADKFSIQATAGGAGGQIKLEGESAKLLFGEEGAGTGGYTVSKGQDAIISVKYAGSDEVLELKRGNNAFNLDGLNITVNGTFGYTSMDDVLGKLTGVTDATTIADLKTSIGSASNLTTDERAFLNDAIGTSGLADTDNLGAFKASVAGQNLSVMDKTSEAVTFDAKVDSEKITKAVSDMVKELNDIIALVNDEVSTKPKREYSPLSDEQKEALSEEQIEKWEENAKVGMLFGDSDIRSLTDNLRFIFSSGSDEKNQLASFGISTSTDYGDNGKLVFDEAKFKAALESNPDQVQELFTKKADNATGDKGGFMARLTTVTEKYAATTGSTKGSLIERGGSIYAPTSILNNHLQKSIDSVDDYMDRLQDKLETETDRYISQFTNLETLISQMNSQSSWMSQQFGA